MSCQAVTNGFKCGKGTVTFSAVDPSIVQHAWVIDGTPYITAQVQRTYNEQGMHSIVYGGTNSCGGVCAKTTQLEIVDVSPPPQETSGGAPPPINPLVIVAVVALGFLGIVMLKKKK